VKDLKIDQYLAKIWTKVWLHVFKAHGVVKIDTVNFRDVIIGQRGVDTR